MNRSQKGMKAIYYTGSSMNPILREGDKLYYTPYRERMIEPGDVVVINSPSGKMVIHRVLSVDAKGIKTRGDNTYAADNWVLSRGQIIGRGICAVRSGKIMHIHGGLPGRICACPTRSMHSFLWLSFRILKPLYNFLSKSSVLGFLPLKTRVLAFQRPEGVELQLYLQGHHIGRKSAGGEWQIRPPFRLLLKESALNGIDEGYS